MNLVVKEFSDAERGVYEAFLKTPEVQEHLTFFHSWEWGSFMAETSMRCIRFGVYKQEQLIAVGQASLKKLKYGTYWYVPRGIVTNYSRPAVASETHRSAADFLQSHHYAGFIRVDPNIIKGTRAEKIFDALGAKKAYIFTQAERVWLIDMQSDIEKQLLWMKNHGMRKKMPYYLRRAEKDGVTVRVGTSQQDLDVLLRLLQSLHDRKGNIGLHPDAYYSKQLSLMSPKGYEKVFIAEINGAPLAACLVAIYGAEASYLHAASTTSHNHLAPAHYLQYEVLKYLIKHHPSVSRYNLWGIVSDKNRQKKHPRNGYSEFKRSLGGYKAEYIRSRDIVYTRRVWRVAWLLDAVRTYRYKND